MVEDRPEGQSDGQDGAGGSPGALDDRDRALGEERERARLAREAELLERGRREQAERAAAAAAAPSRPATPPALTREQLAQAVEDGSITQAVADGEIARQERDRTKLEMREEYRAELAQRDIQAQVDAYYEADPELMAQSIAKQGPKYERTAAEFERLVTKLGLPRNITTELITLETTQPKPGTTRTDQTPSRREGMAGGGGGGGGGGVKTPVKTDGPPEGFPDAYVPQYKKWIEQGMFKGWSDPRIKAQIPFMRRAS